MSDKQIVNVQFCCNDASGNPTGKAEAVHFGDLELTCTLIGGGVIFRQEPKSRLRVGRIVVPCFGYSSWYGNWCWDAAAVRLRDAVEIVNYLMRQKYWECEGGPCELFDAMKERRRVTAAELVTAL